MIRFGILNSVGKCRIGNICCWDLHQNIKRVAYAPSIGVSEIPKDYERSFKDEVSKFKALSIREDKGKEIIKELVHKDAKVLIDPTMMLSKK